MEQPHSSGEVVHHRDTSWTAPIGINKAFFLHVQKKKKVAWMGDLVWWLCRLPVGLFKMVVKSLYLKIGWQAGNYNRSSGLFYQKCPPCLSAGNIIWAAHVQLKSHLRSALCATAMSRPCACAGVLSLQPGHSSSQRYETKKGTASEDRNAREAVTVLHQRAPSASKSIIIY